MPKHNNYLHVSGIMSEKTKKKRSKHNIKNILWALRIVWELSKLYVIGNIFFTLYNYGLWIFNTLIFTQYIFGSSEMLRSFPDVLCFIGLTLILYGVNTILSLLFSRWYAVYKQHEVNEKLNRMVFDKVINVDISCFEDSDFYDSYTKAAHSASGNIFGIFHNAISLIGACLSSLYVIYTMFTHNVWIGLMSMIPVIVSYTIGKLQNNINYEKSMELIPANRKIGYVNRTFFLQKYAKEMRLSNAPSLLMHKLNEGTDEFIKVSRKYAIKLTIVSALNSALCFPILFEGTWLLGAWLVMVKEALSISEYVVIATAAVNTTWMIRSCTQSLLAIFDNSLYIDNLKTFLNYKERIPEDQPGLPVPSHIETLEFRDVSFRYKDNLPNALRDINLTLHAGELTTIVGYNGSGKSTLVKLIMRLYDPTEGKILLNGVDIREYNLRKYRKLIGATFQDFQLFSMSVTDNVCLCNNINGDKKAVTINALQQSGVYERIMELDNGIDNILTREFDDNGAQLSGGEGQKVAISRAFAKKSSILILDEPSSALDPFAEHHVFANFVKLCRESNDDDSQKKISVFISHRLSSATIADRVILMSDGMIAELGTHYELMANNGAYADMFKKQAENYQDIAEDEAGI